MPTEKTFLVRLTAEEHRLIKKAAGLKQVSMNVFLARSASRAAARLLEEHAGRCPSCGRKA